MMMSPRRDQPVLMLTTIFIGLISVAFSAKTSEDFVERSIQPTLIYSVGDPKLATHAQNDFLKSTLRIRRESPGGGCVLPQSMANGTYSLLGSLKLEEGQLAPYNSILQLKCPSGYVSSNNGFNFCEETKNDWFEELATCQKTCKPPKSLTVEFTCAIPSKNGQFNRGSCDQLLPSGTTATPKCRSGHHSITSNKVIFCNNGRWRYSMPSCKAECGKPTPQGTANVINGTNALKGEFPWHVAIYSTYGQQKENPVPSIWCGGTIISRSLAISAAHCFYDPGSRKSFDVDLFTASVGKVYSDFIHPEETMDPFIQKTGIKQIEIPSDYEGELSSYSHDLALLVMETPLNFSNLIMPICLNLVDKDFDEDQSAAGLDARVAGFGLVQVNGEVADVLKTAVMPIISKSQCKSESPQEFIKYITWDKLCAGYLTGIGVCKGDSGGGLVVSSLERNIPTWYLTGIVSTAPSSETHDKCSTNTYSTFTKPFMHKNFIEDVMYKDRCSMPNNPPNGKFGLIDLKSASPGEGVAHKSQIYLKCDKGFAPSDLENNVCDEFIDDWIREAPTCEVIPATQAPVSDLNTRVKIEGCTIPNHPPYGIYTVFGQEDKKPGDLVPPFSLISLNCSAGYSSSSAEINICDQNTNNWKSDHETCAKLCDPLESKTVKFNCINPLSKQKDQIVDCSEPVPSGSSAMATCKMNHYSKKQLSTLHCKDGSWDKSIPNCIEKMCKPLKSLTVNYECTVPSDSGKYINCSTALPSGSTATPYCPRGYYAINRYYSNITCVHDRWVGAMPRCEAECGKIDLLVSLGFTNFKVAASAPGVHIPGSGVPWHVLVYRTIEQGEDNPSTIFLCGGSIVSSTFVLSAAHCFYDPDAGRPFDARQFTVTAGKRYSDFLNPIDLMNSRIQKTGVKRIDIPADYKGKHSNYSHDLAVLLLKTPLKFDSFLMPVCIDLDDFLIDEIQSSDVDAKISGFGLVKGGGDEIVSDYVKTVDVPIISIKDCLAESPLAFSKYITQDKLCMGNTTTGFGVCKGDGGSGLAVGWPDSGNLIRWYLRGIVSIAPVTESNDTCSTNTYSTFTRPFIHKEFISDIINKKGCEFPEHPPNGNYTIIGLKSVVPGELVDYMSQMTLSCDEGFTPSDEEGNVCDEYIDDWIDEFSKCRGRGHNEILPSSSQWRRVEVGVEI